MRLSMRDIYKRLSSLSESNVGEYMKPVIREAYENAKKHEKSKDIIFCIENWRRLPFETESTKFIKMLELFDILAIKGSLSEVREVSNFICESVTRVRDPKETREYLKRKMSYFKSKTAGRAKNSLLHDIEDMNSISNQISEKLSNSQPNFNIQSGSGNQDQSETPGDSVQESTIKPNPGRENERADLILRCYDNILTEVNKTISCDRVLENYEKLSSRFNIDKIIRENTDINGTKDTTNIICQLVDTYNMPNIIKINSILESVYYGLSKNHCEFSSSNIVEAACDYFLMKENGLKDCKNILESSVFFEEEDMKNINYILSQDSKESEDIDDIIRKEIQETFFFETELPQFENSNNMKELIITFKMSNNLNKESNLDALFQKLSNADVDTDAVEDLLDWIRRIFILNTSSTNIILACDNLQNYFLNILDRYPDEEITNSLLSVLKSEKKVIEVKSTTITSDDKTTIENIELYTSILDNVINSYEEYSNELNKNTQDEKFYQSYSNDERSELIMGQLSEICREDYYDIYPVLEKYIDKVPNDVLCLISEYVSKYPTLVDNNKYKLLLQKTSLLESKSTNQSLGTKYLRMACYTEAMQILENKTDLSISNIFECYQYIENINTFYEALDDIQAAYNEYTPVLEMTFKNKIALVSEKLKKGLQKLSDKDKQLSKTIDSTIRNIGNAADKSLTNDNREAIIKGQILPSASKLLKVALASGASLVLFHQPIITAIALLGYLGCSVKYKAKERQMVIDEIEIELKMVQKYIDLAESQNDLKALRQLLTIQRDLERQRQRIKYKMKVVHNQKVPSIEDTSRDGLY